ncbi:YabP/YqfC family sporulation protein [uncultured Tyzzerella sp.]|uniref:YabP/YqfC family sporulation protein n=1 Tax=uncultured Tyzzerella sp. TaxID=2321398 RepID=UPI0029431987|nr:YabP/YqfC family sporulation protein [uncultured Tyzzerella sp.]
MKKNKAPNNLIRYIKKGLTENIELPNEIVLNVPLITVVGKNKILIENFKNIVQYSNETIKINTSCGIFKIVGKNLFLKELNKNKILIKGILKQFEFI